MNLRLTSLLAVCGIALGALVSGCANMPKPND